MAEKRALMLASVASMIDQFNIPNIQLLQKIGYKVDVVADFTNPGTITNERAKDLKEQLNKINVEVIDVAIPRSINPKLIFEAYRGIRVLIESKHYDLIHCHSPIGGAVCRIAAKSERKRGTKIIYTAHGFHFYKGAPLKNWLLFYPVEKLCSYWTDVLITINTEDYELAERNFAADKIKYVPGVGVDIVKFKNIRIDRQKKRALLNISDDIIVLLSVGELNVNKNHQIVLKALAKLNDKKIHYVIAGEGIQREYLVSLASKLGISSQLHLLGYRRDVPELCQITDMYILPSIREGLNVSVMEAMASGLPCLIARIRGNTDLIDEGKGGFLFNPLSIDDVSKAIEKALIIDKIKFGAYNTKKIEKFSTKMVNKIMYDIYQEIGAGNSK